jgi:aspartyl/asparaginyl-tRNA synthetase
MFEFESKGDFKELQKLEEELLQHLGFGQLDTFVHKSYDELKAHYQTAELTSKEENAMLTDFGNVVFLERFPQYTSPFWNMKKEGEYANKIDVIIHGQETIGSAERSTDPTEMRKLFHTISNGEYAQTLYSLFGEDRVEKELEAFLELSFFPRFGGGIGMTRLLDAVSALQHQAPPRHISA